MGHRNVAFDKYLAKQLKNPAFKAEFEKASAEIHAVDRLTRAIIRAVVAERITP